MKELNKTMKMGSFLLLTGIILGAMGAHYLRAKMTAGGLVTYLTGVRYQMWGGLGVIGLGVWGHLHKKIKVDIEAYLLFLGVLLFSFNCYVYALGGPKFVVHIVPVGGVCMMLAWGMIFWKTWTK